MLRALWAQLPDQCVGDTNSCSTSFSQLYGGEEMAVAMATSSRCALSPKCKQASSCIPAVID